MQRNQNQSETKMIAISHYHPIPHREKLPSKNLVFSAKTGQPKEWLRKRLQKPREFDIGCFGTIRETRELRGYCRMKRARLGKIGLSISTSKNLASSPYIAITTAWRRKPEESKTLRGNPKKYEPKLPSPDQLTTLRAAPGQCLAKGAFAEGITPGKDTGPCVYRPSRFRLPRDTRAPERPVPFAAWRAWFARWPTRPSCRGRIG